ncbi:hypothetical protein MRX96_049890 [Rhipicephalus microplus]
MSRMLDDTGGHLAGVVPALTHVRNPDAGFLNLDAIELLSGSDGFFRGGVRRVVVNQVYALDQGTCRDGALAEAGDVFFRGAPLEAGQPQPARVDLFVVDDLRLRNEFLEIDLHEGPVVLLVPCPGA